MGAVLSAERINLSWALRLRFGAVAGQLATILVARFALHVRLHLPPLLLLIGASLLSNALVALYLQRLRGAPPRLLLPALLALDILVLTGLLSLSGGPFNPFSFLYLVHIALAAVVLPERWTWALMLLSVACSGVLFYHHRPLDLGGSGHGDHMQAHLRGMWVAFSIAAGFIVYFLLRVTRALARQEAELHKARERAQKRERLAALATLAAGAAHELATPLGTIALVARELERRLLATLPRDDPDDPDAQALSDARLIRAEVERCRAVLNQLSVDAGQSPGEALAALPAGELLGEAARGLPAVDLQVSAEAAGLPLRLPRRELTRALRGLVKNAWEAGAQHVALRAQARLQTLYIEVEDDGAGMSAEVRARAGDPFFSTKALGAGMGLGIFLCRAVVSSLGGTVEHVPVPGGGTLARVTLPLVPGVTLPRPPKEVL